MKTKNIQINDKMNARLKEASIKSGQKMKFIIEKGIELAIKEIEKKGYLEASKETLKGGLKGWQYKETQ